MEPYTIRTYGDPVLRSAATPVERVDDALRETARRMLETMHSENGLGLAAPQVGLQEALCVLDIPPPPPEAEGEPAADWPVKMPLILFNPRIVSAAETRDAREEGCLSFPGLWAPVIRPEEVTVAYLDEQGEPREVIAGGLLARALQHEIDHLNGVVFIDRISSVKRIALSGRLKRMRRETRERLDLR